jgi:hypothetical protein
LLHNHLGAHAPLADVPKGHLVIARRFNAGIPAPFPQVPTGWLNLLKFKPIQTEKMKSNPDLLLLTMAKFFHQPLTINPQLRSKPLKITKGKSRVLPPPGGGGGALRREPSFKNPLFPTFHLYSPFILGCNLSPKTRNL